MNLLACAISDIQAALLPVAAGLLLEEMTYGGLVRLLLAPRTDTGKQKGPSHSTNRMNGGEKCSH
jgi:hypothetical protein